MTEWIIRVNYNSGREPDFIAFLAKLKQALLKIPDVEALMWEPAPSNVGEYVTVEIFKVQNFEHISFMIEYYGGSTITMWYNHKELKTEVNTKNEAVSTIDEYIRIVLARSAGNNKYMKESRKIEDIKEDINKIRVVHLKIGELNKESRSFITEFDSEDWSNEEILDGLGYNIIKSYGFRMVYMYPYTARDIVGRIFCSKEKYFMFIKYVFYNYEYQGYWEFPGNKVFVIEPKGRELSEKTVEEILKTKKDMLRKMEEYIKETLY